MPWGFVTELTSANDVTAASFIAALGADRPVFEKTSENYPTCAEL
jgi:hypothetical protein